MIDRHIDEDNTFGLASIPLLPLADPTDLESEVMETHFENLTAYKNRNGGLWGRGDLYVYSNMKLADNAIGMTQAAGDIGSSRFNARLVDSLVVGETDNIGNPTTPEEIAYGRSLPKPLIPDFPIRGYEYYDYRDDVVNTTFVNFQDNDRRKTGALSFLLFTSAGLSTGSTISGAKFVNAKPVYFPKYDSRFDNDNRGGNAYRTLSFRDLDGSVTGIPDSQVLLHDGENDSVATDDSCEIHPTWNASVCTGDIGRLNLSDSRGELPAAVNLESRTARFALLASIGGIVQPLPLRPAASCSSGCACAGGSPRVACGNPRLPSRPSRWFATARNSRSPATRAPCVPAPRSRSKPKDRKSLSVWPKWTRAHGSYLNCRVSPMQPPERNRAAWTHCARRTRLPISGTGMPSGSNWSCRASVADRSSNGSASQYSGQQIGSVSRTERSPRRKPGAFLCGG